MDPKDYDLSALENLLQELDPISKCRKKLEEKYTFLKECGQGAYGAVYLVQDRYTGQKYALKICHLEHWKTERRGVRAAVQGRQCEGLVTIHNSEPVEGFFCYFMEPADDLGTGKVYSPAVLSKVLRKRKSGHLNAREVLVLARQLLTAVGKIHKKGWVHRDIKPDNVIFIKGKPYLSDIGLLAIEEEAPKLLGTPGFIPPEKIASRADFEYTYSDDLYALGMLLYVCWTGNAPGGFPDIPVSEKEDEKKLREAILKATARKEEARFKSVSEFENALNEILDNKTPAAEKGKQEDIPEEGDIFFSYSRIDRILYGEDYINLICGRLQEIFRPIIGRDVSIVESEPWKNSETAHRSILDRLKNKKYTIFLALDTVERRRCKFCKDESEAWPDKEAFFTIMPWGEHETDPVKWKKATDIQRLKEFFVGRLLSAPGNHPPSWPKLTENFTGRRRELLLLRQFCLAGGYPVITAAGGIGKTELAAAYAKAFAWDYRKQLLLHMEGFKSWQEAILADTNRDFRECLESCAKNVSEDSISAESPREENSEKNQAGGLKTPTENPDEKYQHLLEIFQNTASQENVLLFLDNMDAPELLTQNNRRELNLPDRLHIIATTRIKQKYGKERAQYFKLDEFSEADARELFEKNSGKPENEAEEKAFKGIIKLLGGHAWALELVSAQMRDEENISPFQTKLRELQENFNISGRSYRREVKEDTRKLLEQSFVQISLRNSQIGEQLRQLLAFAALFQADKIPRQMLEMYCEQKEFNAQTAFDLLKKYSLWTEAGEDCFKMHRLTQAGAENTDKEWLKETVTFLKENIAFTVDHWISVLEIRPEMFPWAPTDYFSQSDWVTLLRKQPKLLKKYTRWKDFQADHWYRLLKGVQNEEQAEGLIQKYLEYGGNQLRSSHWSSLLTVFDFSLQKYKLKIDFSQFTGSDWCQLLSGRPSSKFVKKCAWNQLTGTDWSQLLSVRLQEFSDICPWDKLSGTDWSRLLTAQNFGGTRQAFEKFSRKNWLGLLRKKPEFKNCCGEWEYFSCRDWVYLLRSAPSLWSCCPENKRTVEIWITYLGQRDEWDPSAPGDDFSGEYWSRLLAKCPQYKVQCDEVDGWLKFTGQHWSELLAVQPGEEFAEKCLEYDGWEKMTPGNWSELLARQPQFQEQFESCYAWDELSGDDWSKLLSEQPRFEAQFRDCCTWEIFSSENWYELLSRRPRFARECQLGWIKTEELAAVLANQPQLVQIFCSADGQKITEILSCGHWGVLLKARPYLFQSERLPWEELSASAFFDLLEEQPQFAENCSPEIWEQAEGANWFGLLYEQPQFAEKCTFGGRWEKIGRFALKRLLRRNPHFFALIQKNFDLDSWCAVLQDLPHKQTECPEQVWQSFTPEHWCDLLRVQPRFAEKCSPEIWQRFGERNWWRLLLEQPQFAEKCFPESADRIGRETMVWLLCRQPQLAVNCSPESWRRFDGKNWRHLLLEQPQFAEKCTLFDGWSKIDGSDLVRLLHENPQYFIQVQESLSTDVWCSVLQALPHRQTACAAEIWNSFTPEHWGELLYLQPQFSDRCPKEIWRQFDGNIWSRLLQGQPQFAEKCTLFDGWHKIDGSDWCWLLQGNFQYFIQFQNNSSTEGWGVVLQKFPHKETECPAEIWSRFTPDEWAELLCEQLRFAARCPQEIWRQFDGLNWYHLLLKYPQFAERCTLFDGWHKISRLSWARLLRENPQYFIQFQKNSSTEGWCFVLQKFPHKETECPAEIWSRFTPDEWAELLCEQLRFAARCPQEIWRQFDGKIWSRLLQEQPQFAERCTLFDGWHKISRSSWARLLRKNPQYFIQVKQNSLLEGWCGALLELPHKCNECPEKIWQEFTSRHWFRLLCRHPKLADKCPPEMWESFTRMQWERLLSLQPDWRTKRLQRNPLSGTSETE